MSIGERIRYFRILHGMTQRELGTQVGFSPSSADVRIAQYESGGRKPKSGLTAALADILNVSPGALTVPDIDSETGLMHTLFALEDLHGLKPFCVYGEMCLCLDGADETALRGMLIEWCRQAAKLRRGEITQEEYDRWRYNFS